MYFNYVDKCEFRDIKKSLNCLIYMDYVGLNLNLNSLEHNHKINVR